jgi:hypothetical protein
MIRAMAALRTIDGIIKRLFIFNSFVGEQEPITGLNFESATSNRVPDVHKAVL